MSTDPMRRTAADAAAELARASRRTRRRSPKESYRETVEAIVVAVHPRAPGPRVRGRGVRDPDRLDGPDPDGPAQGGHLPAVRLRLRGQRLRGGRGLRRRQPAARRVDSGICVNCRFQAPVDDAPSFKGDRILVMKFPYDLPFLPGRVGPRALGRGRLPLSRGARGQLHQAARRPARRDAPDLLRRHLHQAAGRRRRSGSSASRSSTSRRCR